MGEIKGSVGYRGKNESADVVVIQRMLNQVIQPQLKALDPDGKAGRRTNQAIAWFQSNKVSMKSPDYRIDPDGPTLRTLRSLQPPRVNAPVEKPERKDPGPARPGDPILLTPDQAHSLMKPHSELMIGGIWGSVRAGETWLGTDGRRLVLTASYSGVIFMLDKTGAVYLQSAKGFIGEVTTYPFIEGARRAAPMARLIEWELELIMGVVAATSGVGLVAVLGVSALRFIVENRDDFGRWNRILKASLEARATLKSKAPTLYDNVVDAVLLTFFKEVIPQTPGAVKADKIAYATGIVVGKLGKLAVEKKFNVFRVAMILLFEFAKRCALATPEALKNAAGEYQGDPDKLIQTLREAGTTVTRDEAVRIYAEIRAHPQEIQSALNKVVEAAR